MSRESRMIRRCVILASSLLAALALAPRLAAAEEPCPPDVGQHATFERGEALRSSGDFACAADQYQRFAEASPRADSASFALDQALTLRLALGDFARAEKLLDAIVKMALDQRTARPVHQVLDFASALSRQERWPELERFLALRRSIVEQGTSPERVVFQQLMARCLAKQGKQTAADAAYLKLSKYHPGLTEVRREIVLGGAEPSVPAPNPAFAAFGEAVLNVADRARDRALALTIRAGDAAALRAKRIAVGKAELVYGEIFYGRAIPPSMVASAAGSVARLRSQLWAQTYLAMGPLGADAEEKSAIEGNRACVEKGVEVKAVDAGTRACVVWLDRHRFQRFPALRELAPAPRTPGKTAAEAGGWAWRYPR